MSGYTSYTICYRYQYPVSQIGCVSKQEMFDRDLKQARADAAGSDGYEVKMVTPKWFYVTGPDGYRVEHKLSRK